MGTRHEIYGELKALYVEKVTQPALFGAFPLDEEEIVFQNQHAHIVLNHKCVWPGHVMVITRDPAIQTVNDLSKAAPSVRRSFYDLIRSCTQLITDYYHADNGVTVSIQDGKSSGQTVPHLHAHIIPRVPNNIPPHLKNKYALYTGCPDDLEKVRSTIRTIEDRYEEKQAYFDFVCNQCGSSE